MQSSGSEVLLLAKEGWHSGVVGIVASKLVEEYNRPVVVIGLERGVGRGSARTTHGFHLYEGLKSASAVLERFGGHAAAAGLSVKSENIETLRQLLCDAYRKQLGKGERKRTVSVEASVRLGEIEPRLIEEFSLLGPFGMGNPEPLLLVEDAEISESRVVGKEHLQVKLRVGDQEEQGIAFGFGKHRKQFALGSRVCAAFVPEFDTYYAGPKRIRLRVKELSNQGG